jgi:hypothetical protein
VQHKSVTPHIRHLFLLCVGVCLQAKIVPESILQTCIKISNEPPSDMKSNMRSVSDAV